jgi:predicted CoA-binding protein
MTAKVIEEILSKYKTVAIVGLSDDLSRPSYTVAEYLKNHGFRIIPVNPLVKEVLGEKSYESLLRIPVETQRSIQIVDIFRRSEDVPPVVEQAVQLKKLNGVPDVIWMQLGIIHEKAAEMARKEDMIVVMDKCMRIEHQRLFGNEEQ